ncbi:cobalt ABC transporter ATP-binding protein [Hydrococcus rivularis NIES-593]|uniref:ABC transporter ATP-binding protein n=1 Tax=Hydrococcus rivularis NIES-593 TaxID=1921803 RepID=A0A1U7HIZ2_9CYAN|nr:ABC transporter ATP-binding protein [Hydrococcus rivularis]OKH23524.1 cobalt ABC transporter ATP-binding protein [Hydrococcus rivularis NIES-593]
MSQWLLEFEDVYYTYPGMTQPAIASLTLRIPQGKRCAVIGQNGCGKTTLFLLANGLYKPQQGKIYWQGKPLNYNRQSLIQLRQQVGLVFQNPEQQLIASTVEEDISYGLCNLGLSEIVIAERVKQILTQFGLNSLATRPIHQLSLGQKKRVCLAGVMVLQPTLLLLDEPTAYLDPLHTRQLAQTLTKIHGAGTTILMATHDLEWVYRWADWVFVLEQGKLVLEGTPQDVFTQQDIMETLQLGVPLAFELLSLLDKVDRVTMIEQLKTKILHILFQHL